jgi:hypothetical protein
MTLTLTLDPELEERLNREAARSGITPDEYALHLLEERLAPPAPVDQLQRNQAAIALLRRLREEGDPEEQRETGEYLMRVLDEDRLSYRKLFP